MKSYYKITSLNWKKILAISLFPLMFQACETDSPQGQDTKEPTTSTPVQTVKVPDFSADSAYAFIEKQLSFGFRIPGTVGQEKCAAWMATMLKLHCDTLYVQKTKVKAGNAQMLPCINLIGAIHPQAKNRILLLTHWDSRPWADQDDSAANKPIMAADDAASGVGVLIEMARLLKSQNISKDWGIDIFFTDVEDYGKTEWGEESYCLGTQYWAKNLHVPQYKANFGILLDMVGARGATFPIEMISAQYAANIQKDIYQAAHRAGYSSFFPFIQGPAITDDHKFVNELVGIPTVDIINLSTDGVTPFKRHWHTHDDNINIIDKNTLKAVGQSLLQFIYETTAEKPNAPAS